MLEEAQKASVTVAQGWGQGRQDLAMLGVLLRVLSCTLGRFGTGKCGHLEPL